MGHRVVASDRSEHEVGAERHHASLLGLRHSAMSLLSRIAALSSLLLAFWLRLQDLGSESLWYDETVSAYLASLDIPTLIAHTARDIHPPGYYLILHGWRWLAAPSLAHGLEFLYTWPSLWFGLLLVALTGAIAAWLGGRWAGVMALLLAALNPFQIMYAQEVRMYSLGATCLLLTLAAALHILADVASDRSKHEVGALRPQAHPQPQSGKRLWGALVLYVLAALAGLYTLYYFIFWLLVLVPLIALAIVFRRQAELYHARRLLAYWLAAQALVLVGWLPWLPIFLHQALEPPVPPWRVPWADSASFFVALFEGLAAPLVGQSAPGGVVWFWAGLGVLVVVAYYDYTKSSHRSSHLRPGARLLPILALAPPALIYTISLIWTPLYHVRYLATYAPVFLILAGLLLTVLSRRSLLASALLALILIAGSLTGLTAYRQDPALRADDHRAAVAHLAREWRPGDVILVNAGWVYTALALYWPDTPTGPLDAAPPPIAAFPRLNAFTDSSERSEPSTPASAPWPAPVMVRGGSVDGSSSLGWGEPTADFYAISAAETVEKLDDLARTYRRIWHYRLYDTVSDPTGVIRDWFARQGSLFFETTYSGPGYLRVEGVMAHGQAPPAPSVQHDVHFGDHIVLRQCRAAPDVAAGSMLYVALEWAWLPDRQDEEISASLRLYGPDAMLVAQADEPLAPSAPTSLLALPVPAASPPGTYTLELVVYRRSDLSPLPAYGADETEHAPASPLGSVTVTLPKTAPATGPVLTQWVQSAIGVFDYLELIEAHLPESAPPGGQPLLDLVWRPRPSEYRDNYTLTVTLRPLSDDGAPLILATAPLGGSHYPSAQWTAGYPVRQIMPLPLPGSLAQGAYSVHISLARSADGLVIPARTRWPFFTAQSLKVGTLTIEP